MPPETLEEWTAWLRNLAGVHGLVFSIIPSDNPAKLNQSWEAVEDPCHMFNMCCPRCSSKLIIYCNPLISRWVVQDYLENVRERVKSHRAMPCEPR